jgi:hypothetical protein
MRTPTLLAIFGAAMLSAAAYAGPTSITPDASSPAMASVQTIQGAPHKLHAEDADAVVGRYDLSDGQILRVSFEHRKLFAEVGDRKTELVPAGRNTFVSLADDTRFVFDQLPFANDVAISRK